MSDRDSGFQRIRLHLVSYGIQNGPLEQDFDLNLSLPHLEKTLDVANHKIDEYPMSEKLRPYQRYYVAAAIQIFEFIQDKIRDKDYRPCLIGVNCLEGGEISYLVVDGLAKEFHQELIQARRILVTKEHRDFAFKSSRTGRGSGSGKMPSRTLRFSQRFGNKPY